MPVVLPLWTGRGDCDWFTASILQFYLLFPWLFKLFRRYNVAILYAVITLLSILILEKWSFAATHWQMSCFVSRFPTFVSGIVLYNVINKRGSLWQYVLISVVGFVYAIAYGHQFLFTAMASPFVAALLSVCFSVIKKNNFLRLVCYPIEKIGNRSLESYYGGWFTGYFTAFFYNNIMGLAIYIGQTLCGAFCLAKINDFIKNNFNVKFEKMIYRRYVDN